MPFLHDFNPLISDVQSIIHIIVNMPCTPNVNKSVTFVGNNRPLSCIV